MGTIYYDIMIQAGFEYWKLRQILSLQIWVEKKRCESMCLDTCDRTGEDKKVLRQKFGDIKAIDIDRI